MWKECVSHAKLAAHWYVLLHDIVKIYYIFKKSISGRCSGLGFNDGCCVPGQNQNCHGSDGICYCDEICYNYGDCCEDIEEINCFKGENECIKMSFNCFKKILLNSFIFLMNSSSYTRTRSVMTYNCLK